MKGWSMRIFFPWGAGLFTYGPGNEEKVGSFRVHLLENIRVVQSKCSRTKMRDVGCDRMVFAINSDLFLIK